MCGCCRVRVVFVLVCNLYYWLPVVSASFILILVIVMVTLIYICSLDIISISVLVFDISFITVVYGLLKVCVIEIRYTPVCTCFSSHVVAVMSGNHFIFYTKVVTSFPMQHRCGQYCGTGQPSRTGSWRRLCTAGECWTSPSSIPTTLAAGITSSRYCTKPACWCCIENQDV